ncbi:MAG: DUF4358 domain-containing protein [Ruminococcaceae bacterium]|nr:DUF4358 domain-containing protein [Oscillospiraceae bacterium]
MKRISILLAIFMLVGILAGCGKAAVDPGIDKLTEAVDTVAEAKDRMISFDEDMLNNLMKLDKSSYEAANVKKASIGINIDEYGIIKGKDAKQAGEIKTAVEAYIKMRQDSWMKEYLPEEFPKLKDAKIITNGNYVMYFILSEEMKQAAEKSISELFAK